MGNFVLYISLCLSRHGQDILLSDFLKELSLVPMFSEL